MKLGLLLASPPDRPELDEAYRSAIDALKSKEDVYLYLIDDGVKNLDHPKIAELRNQGVKLFACAYGAKKRGIEWNSEKATFSGLTVLVDIIAGCNRFLAYTPQIQASQFSSMLGEHPMVSGLPRTLITIREDPRESHRPAEAIRIGAGIGGWKKTDVDFLLYGTASHILSPYADEFVDGENYEHYLPIVREWKRPIYLAADAEKFEELEDSETSYQWCDSAKEKELYQNAAFLIPF